MKNDLTYNYECLIIQLHEYRIFQTICKSILTDIFDDVVHRVENGRDKGLNDDTIPFSEIEIVRAYITISSLLTNENAILQFTNKKTKSFFPSVFR